MGLNLLDRIQAKIELFRLEQRYTRRRHRRSTFVSNAIYVDGEYIYQSPNTTGSSASTSRTNNASHIDTSVRSGMPSPTSTVSPTSPTESVSKAQKRLNRWSSMPGFGSTTTSGASRPSQGPAAHSNTNGANDWRMGQQRRSFEMR
ncbi:hypothetical protein V8F20_007107 [Naviculisporaceae sp. PSN 640]